MANKASENGVSISNVFGARPKLNSYNPNKPTVSWDGLPTDLPELIYRLNEAGIPFTTALKYFTNNPEGSASETLNLASDEVVPFKWQLRTGNATPKSLAEEALLIAAPGPKKRGKFAVDEAATKRVNNWIAQEIAKEPTVNVKYTSDGVPVVNGHPMGSRGYNLSELSKPQPQYTNMYLDMFPEANEIRNKFPTEYNNIIIDEPARYGSDGRYNAVGNNKISTAATIDNHFEPGLNWANGELMVAPNSKGQKGALQLTRGEYEKLLSDYKNSEYAEFIKPYSEQLKKIFDNPNLTDAEKQSLKKSLKENLETERMIDNLD